MAKGTRKLVLTGCRMLCSICGKIVDGYRQHLGKKHRKCTGKREDGHVKKGRGVWGEASASAVATPGEKKDFDAIIKENKKVEEEAK